MEKFYVKCNFCGKDDTKLFLEGEKGKAVECKNCGLIYINPRPKFDDIKDIYEEDYVKFFTKRREKKIRRSKKILKHIIKFCPPQGVYLILVVLLDFFFMLLKPKVMMFLEWNHLYQQ